MFPHVFALPAPTTKVAVRCSPILSVPSEVFFCEQARNRLGSRSFANKKGGRFAAVELEGVALEEIQAVNP
jgi:hypothetical protein